ncbi:MAG: hypothetical protein LC745_02910 [Planctomycetia bacterium]|nr:hypothetical protein [Planctomycetia bacterium]
MQCGCYWPTWGSEPVGCATSGPTAFECADAETARLLASDRRLGNVCHPAGERLLVYRAEDEAAVRARLRKLGFVVPPSE